MVKQKLDKPPRTIRKKRKPKVLPLFQAHDKFFKIVFQDKENASDFLKTYFMPQFPDISLDLDTLHLDDAQHVSSKLHPLFSDVIYRCQLKDDTICVLCVQFGGFARITDSISIVARIQCVAWRVACDETLQKFGFFEPSF
jgi:hypothetical protein